MGSNGVETNRSSIESKIRAAREIYAAHGRTLLAQPAIRGLLDRAAESASASLQAMIECGVVTACRRCDEEEGGSCCGAGIENKYNPTLLLINLLMGVELPDERRSPNSCHFLGERGCSLKVRHVLCINYLCTGLQKALEGEKLFQLQSTTGDEMDAIFLLHETIKKQLTQLIPWKTTD